MDQSENIMPELARKISNALSEKNNWMAYNTLGLIEKGEEVYFFKDKAEVVTFSQDNISDYDSFNVMHIKSVNQAIEQLMHDRLPDLNLLSVPDHHKNTINQSSNFTNMNEKNFDYLKDQLKYTGFGESANTDLKEKMQQQSAEFKIFHKQDFGQDHAVATLHFRKSDQSDMYFLNRYDLHLKNDKSEQVAKQTFYMGKDNNITLKEGYNLMSGRAVNKDLTAKEGQVYNAWIQLNFKETDKQGNYQMSKFHQNYGFDLEKELAKHPIKELGNEQDKARLVESLQRGNRQSVTVIRDGSEQKLFLEANPKFKTLTVYDQSMQRVQSQSQKEKNTPQQSVKQESAKQAQKQTDDSDGMPKAKQKRAKRKKQSI